MGKGRGFETKNGPEGVRDWKPFVLSSPLRNRWGFVGGPATYLESSVVHLKYQAAQNFSERQKNKVSGLVTGFGYLNPPLCS